MVSLISGIPGASSLLNSLTDGLDGLSSTLLGGLTAKASTVSSALLANFTTLTGSLRDILPEIPALPNVNLPALLGDLSGIDITGIDGIANLSRHATLLTRGKDLFNDAVSAAGFDFDTLVDKALVATNLGDTLSDFVPNIEVDALGLFPAFQKANEIKFPEVAPALETVRKAFTANSSLTDHIATVATNVKASLAAIT